MYVCVPKYCMCTMCMQNLWDQKSQTSHNVSARNWPKSSTKALRTLNCWVVSQTYLLDFVYFFNFVFVFVLDRISHWPWAHPICEAGWTVSPGALPLTASPALVLQACTSMPHLFYVGSGGWIRGFILSTLQSQLFLQPETFVWEGASGNSFEVNRAGITVDSIHLGFPQ